MVSTCLVLPLGCVVAFVYANASPESYYRVSHAMDFAINDVAIALFFGVMTTEIVEESLAGGVLHSWRRTMVPVAAAVGSLLVPIAIYEGFLHAVGEPMLADAWVVTTATDLAACYVVGGLVFGRHPALPFLLLMSIASNAIGLLLIAELTSTSHLQLLAGLMVVALAMASATWLRRRRHGSFWPYLLGPGVLSWTGLYLAGVHPALALVPVVALMPHARRDAGLLAEPSPRHLDTMSRFERWWAMPVQLVLFLFGFVNGGVPYHGLEAGMWSVPLSTILGRPIGALVAVELVNVLGAHQIPGVRWKELLVVGLCASSGLTMALFFSTAIMAMGPVQLELKTGSIISVIGCLLAIAAGRVLGVGRFDRQSVRTAG
jgi:NhaA family Na+:H+ antiporter